MFRTILVVLSLAVVARTQTCESPQFTVNSFSTQDARIAVESAAQLEIGVKCKSGKQPSTLYADINGQIIPCAQSTSAPGKYFVGVTSASHKELPSGRISVKLYDDESYAALRKARTDDALKAVKPFGIVELNHPGVSYGPWLPSEFMAVIVFGLVWWAAYRERSKILA